MGQYRIYTAGHTAALSYAQKELSQIYHFLPYPDKTATHLLLPVPSFASDGTIKGGDGILPLLRTLGEDVTIIGGNLNRTEFKNYRTLDLLQDPFYLTENAHITACCAIKYALNALPVILPSCRVLVIGWGRIGKCLSHHLKQMGADVTVCARKEIDRATASSLGYATSELCAIIPAAYRVIFNTVPAMVMPTCPEGPVKIDLASSPGIGGEDVIRARSLPNKDAPESSGKLIAKTVIRLLRKEEG